MVCFLSYEIFILFLINCRVYGVVEFFELGERVVKNVNNVFILLSMR